MKVILISGKAEAGKDSTLEILKPHLESAGFKCCRLAFGDYVKDTARELWGWDGEKDEKGRALLQWWGTDYVRANFPDFWADTVVRLAMVIKDDVDYLLVPDLRFVNEILCWRGTRIDRMVVRVERPGHISRLTPEQLQHISETNLDKWDFEYTLMATNLAELTKEVESKLLIPILQERGKYK